MAVIALDAFCHKVIASINAATSTEQLRTATRSAEAGAAFD
jgi:hypothetical protein